MKKALMAGLAGTLLMLPSCAKVEITHKVEPIHLTVDINIRVDRQLDNFFAFEQQQGNKAQTQPASDGKTNAAETATTKGAAR